MSKSFQIYSDGGARGNPGPAAIGVVVFNEAGECIDEFKETIGPTTNNVAEYKAVIQGLEMATAHEAESIEYFVDSQLVAFQLSGKYKIKTPHIRDLYLKVKEKEKTFKAIEYHHVPRTHERIRLADKLVNQALDEAGH